MTKSYFKQVPDFEYVTRTKGNTDISNYITIKNLFKRGKIRSDIFGNLSYFTKYKIIGDERPDNVAFKEYNDSSLDWVILLANNILNNSDYGVMQPKYDNKGRIRDIDILINKDSSIEDGMFNTAAHEFIHAAFSNTLKSGEIRNN